MEWNHLFLPWYLLLVHTFWYDSSWEASHNCITPNLKRLKLLAFLTSSLPKNKMTVSQKTINSTTLWKWKCLFVTKSPLNVTSSCLDAIYDKISVDPFHVRICAQINASDLKIPSVVVAQIIWLISAWQALFMESHKGHLYSSGIPVYH